MEILTLGGATQDIFIHYEDAQTVEFCGPHEKSSFLLLQEGAKIEINKIRYSTGGGATNSAVSFKRLGFEVSSFFKIGTDSQGISILQALKKEGVSVAECVIDHHEQTGISYIIPSFRGDRTVLAFRGANAHIKQEEIPFSSFKKYSYLYITSMSGDSSHLLLSITQEAKHHGVTIANNPGISQLTAGAQTLCKSLPFIDILILNRDEARQFMVSLLQSDKKLHESLNQKKHEMLPHAPSLLRDLFTYENTCFSLVHFFKEALARGPRIAVVTNGSEGVYVCSEKTIYFHPSLPVKLVSTLGAGDAFGSGFVAGLALFNSIEQAIRTGILNSSSVITHVDAKEGLLRRDQLDYALKNLDYSLLQKFDFNP
jgi:sugar/nucleoside kinase (ribokinase family)